MCERKNDDVQPFDFLGRIASLVSDRYNGGLVAEDMPDFYREQIFARGYLGGLRDILVYFEERGLNGHGVDIAKLDEVLKSSNWVDNSELVGVLEGVANALGCPEVKHLASSVADD